MPRVARVEVSTVEDVAIRCRAGRTAGLILDVEPLPAPWNCPDGEYSQRIDDACRYLRTVVPSLRHLAVATNASRRYRPTRQVRSTDVGRSRPSDLLYEERVAGWDVDDLFRQRWSALCQRVLAHGGELVVPPGSPEPDLDLLVADGTLLASPVEVEDRGGDCHANVAELWIDGEIAAVGTGYALSGDLWRQHSWGVNSDGGILETKAANERYYGVTLPPGESTVLFALNGFAGDVKTRLSKGGGRTSEIISVLRASWQRRSMAKP